MSESCDRIWEIDALREGRLGAKDAEAFERHLQSCEICTAAQARDERLRELAAELPAPAPTELDLRRLRARVLRDVELDAPSRSPWRNRAVLALVIAACAVAVVAFRHRHANAPIAVAVLPVNSPAIVTSATPSDEPFAGTVTAEAGARWTQTRDNGAEHVRLDDGILSLHVRHQSATEHFYVDLPDGQLEVRGTTFRVEVHNGATTRIDVSEGVVSVRFHGLGEIWVSAGGSWSRAPEATGSVRSPKSSASTSPVSASNDSTPKITSDESAADDYASAVSMMRSGSYDAAATAFGAFLTSHPNASQAEDASYLEASALARAGRSDAAALAAEHHLAAYPHSFHAKEAAILVARAARDRGDCDKARSVLAPWLGSSPDAEVQATLRSCALP